jgi:hypothetical protein
VWPADLVSLAGALKRAALLARQRWRERESTAEMWSGERSRGRSAVMWMSPQCECDGQNRHFCPKSIYGFHIMSNIGRTVCECKYYVHMLQV